MSQTRQVFSPQRQLSPLGPDPAAHPQAPQGPKIPDARASGWILPIPAKPGDSESRLLVFSRPNWGRERAVFGNFGCWGPPGVVSCCQQGTVRPHSAGWFAGPPSSYEHHERGTIRSCRSSMAGHLKLKAAAASQRMAPGPAFVDLPVLCSEASAGNVRLPSISVKGHNPNALAVTVA